MKKRMTLDEWCEQDRRGPSAQAKALGISRATLWRLRGGDHAILPDTARRIEQATGGKVRAATLLGVEA
jgi:DNA-binding transcriptional regulator YdaS (Cro superfamily)